MLVDWRSLTGRGKKCATLCCLAWTLAAASSMAGDGAVAKEVARALADLRGVDVSRLEGKTLEKVTRADVTLKAHSNDAIEAITRAVNAEREDHGFIMIASMTLLEMGGPPPFEALMRCEFARSPELAFRIASHMAASSCSECLPVALKFLEVPSLDWYIEEEHMRLNLEQGLIFTLGACGEAAHEGVARALTSSNCIVQRNAVLALTLLLPEAAPGELAAVSQSSCAEAREKSWYLRGLLADPTFVPDVLERLTSSEKPSDRELGEILSGLGSMRDPAAMDLLELLAKLDDAVAPPARAALDETKKKEPGIDWLRTRPGTAPSVVSERFRVVLAQDIAASEPSEFIAEMPALDFVVALKPDDVPLLQSTRAAIVKTRSHEASQTYVMLARVVRWLRASGRLVPASVPGVVPGAGP